MEKNSSPSSLLSHRKMKLRIKKIIMSAIAIVCGTWKTLVRYCSTINDVRQKEILGFCLWKVHRFLRKLLTMHWNISSLKKVGLLCCWVFPISCVFLINMNNVASNEIQITYIFNFRDIWNIRDAPDSPKEALTYWLQQGYSTC